MATKAAKTKKAEKGLPATVFVERQEASGIDSWLEVTESIDGFEHGAVIGEYELVQTHKKVVRHELE